MGNCLPKRNRRKAVKPVGVHVQDEDIHAILSRSTDFQTPRTGEPSDMVNALKEADKEAETVDQEEENNTEQKQESDEQPVKKAVAFTVGMDDTSTSPRLPARLAERLRSMEQEGENEIEYTDEEEQMMAEILREEILKEKRDNAVKQDIKVYDAKRRRLCNAHIKEQELEIKLNSSTPSLVDQRKRVKDMANEDRRKAAENRTTTSFKWFKIY